MKYGLIVIAIAGAVASGYYFKVPQKLLSLINRKNIHLTVPTPASKSAALAPDASPSAGRVAGISTQAKEAGSDMLQKSLSLGKTVSSFFLSTPTTSSDTIEVGKVINQVSKQVESIPSNLLDQAKVEYCKQVLIEATKSAKP